MRVNLSVRKHNVKSVPLEKCINISTFELPQEFVWTCKEPFLQIMQREKKREGRSVKSSF